MLAHEDRGHQFGKLLGQVRSIYFGREVEIMKMFLFCYPDSWIMMFQVNLRKLVISHTWNCMARVRTNHMAPITSPASSGRFSCTCPLR